MTQAGTATVYERHTRRVTISWKETSGKAFTGRLTYGTIRYMNQISRDVVLKLASLSGLQLDENEIEDLRSDIATILSYVEQLDELDTTQVEPAYQVTGLQNVFRDDSISGGGVTREALLALAPQKAGSSIKVPKVI